MPQHRLNERPGRAENRQAKITARQRANVCALKSEFLRYLDWDGPRCGEFLFEAWKNFAERLEAAGKEAMRVPILGSAWPRLGEGCDLVALEYVDLFEIARQYRRGRQAPDAAANNHRTSPKEIVHVVRSTRFVMRRASAAGYSAIS